MTETGKERSECNNLVITVSTLKNKESTFCILYPLNFDGIASVGNIPDVFKKGVDLALEFMASTSGDDFERALSECNVAGVSADKAGHPIKRLINARHTIQKLTAVDPIDMHRSCSDQKAMESNRPANRK